MKFNTFFTFSQTRSFFCIVLCIPFASTSERTRALNSSGICRIEQPQLIDGTMPENKIKKFLVAVFVWVFGFSSKSIERSEDRFRRTAPNCHATGKVQLVFRYVIESVMPHIVNNAWLFYGIFGSHFFLSIRYEVDVNESVSEINLRRLHRCTGVRWGTHCNEFTALLLNASVISCCDRALLSSCPIFIRFSPKRHTH